MVIASFLIAAVLASQPPPTADRVRRGYIQGSLLLSHHPASGATYHRVDPNLSGDVAAVSVAAGGFLSPTIALEGEFVYGRLVSAPQGFHYSFNIDYVAQNRDMLINELVRYRPESGAPPIGGRRGICEDDDKAGVADRNGVRRESPHPSPHPSRRNGDAQVAPTGGGRAGGESVAGSSACGGSIVPSPPPPVGMESGPTRFKSGSAFSSGSRTPGTAQNRNRPSPTSTLRPPTRTRVIASPAASIEMWMRLGLSIFTPCRLTMCERRSRGMS